MFNGYRTGYLIEELQRVADEVDGRPTQNDMRLEGHVSESTFRGHFGTWTNALAAAEVADERFDPELVASYANLDACPDRW